MLANFLSGVVVGVMTANVVTLVMLLLYGKGNPPSICRVTIRTFRGGLAIAVVGCSVYTSISWALGDTDWFSLGMRNGFLLTIVTHVVSTYLARRNVRRKLHTQNNQLWYQPAEASLPIGGGVYIRPSSAQEIADYRSRFTCTARRPARTRPGR